MLSRKHELQDECGTHVRSASERTDVETCAHTLSYVRTHSLTGRVDRQCDGL
jgi:hypothetical protein